MTITAIIGEQTDKEFTTFKTDPPLTQEVLDEVAQLGGDFRHELLALVGENLLVNGSVPDKATLDLLQGYLSEGERQLNFKTQAAEEAHQGILNYRSKLLGLPVV